MSRSDEMGGVAFPHGNPEQGGHPGEVTLWDYYAAAALTAIRDFGGMTPNYEVMANDAAELADAMLAERAKRTEE